MTTSTDPTVTQPLRVAVVAPRYPPDVGGLENYARWVATSLAADEAFEVVVISTHPGWRTRTDQQDGLQVIRLGAGLVLSNSPLNPWWPFQLRRLFWRHSIDVVNAHSPVPFLADMAVAAAGRRPVVMTYHSGSMVKGESQLVDRLLRTYERLVLPWLFKRSTELVAVSPVAMTHHTGRAVVIPPGVDTVQFHPPPVGAAREPHVLFVGRVELSSRWKGLHVLIDALPAMVEQDPSVVLEVVGDGDALPEMKARADALGVAEHVRWHGRLSHSDLAEVLRRVSVTVLPSLTESESFGMTLIEAMASGCAVVGSDVGGIPFVIRDGVDGLLVPPGDVEALVTTVMTLIQDPVLAGRLGQAGRAAAEDTWDWSRQTQLTFDRIRAAAGVKEPVLEPGRRTPAWRCRRCGAGRIHPRWSRSCRSPSTCTRRRHR